MSSDIVKSVPFHLGRRQAGLSIVEFMVGLALGLLIVAGASSMFVGNIVSARRLQVEARLEQDLRAAMDMITRDLRRGGYWANAMNGVLTANPYNVVSLAASPPAISYAYSRDTNDVLGTDEQFGFRLNTNTGGNGSVDMSLSGNWQAVTDTATMKLDTDKSNITRLDLAADDKTVPLNFACPTGCSVSCQVKIRAYQVVLKGISKTDTAVTRTLVSTVRVRNDAVAGVCNP